MIDYNCTAEDWGMTRSDLLFLPVGALEQHGNHLPINTDCIQAEHFARKLAEHFNGALLPCIPIASSLEHTGWRGAFSLKPETLINVIRDIAENAEMQNYSVMVVVSGHGGNFPLAPACREWNRRDRKLKLLLMHPYEHGAALVKSERMDLHAGLTETSVMRYICNEPFEFKGGFITGNTTSLLQKDLNSFGVGYLNPNGIPGHPEDASAELGEKLVDAIISGSIAELGERLEQLKKMRRYCGKGGLYLRKCVMEDVPELQELSESVNWDQLPADWENFISLGGVWSMVHLNRIVGTAAWIPRDDNTVWIGLVITKPEWRGCSIATRLMQAIIDETSDYQCRGLDASAMGAPVYRRLGFKDGYTVSRIELSGKYDKPSLLDWYDMSEAEAASIAKETNDPLIMTLFSNAPELCKVGKLNGRSAAYFLGRYGLKSVHIGPLCAQSLEFALDAVNMARESANGKVVTMDIMGYQSKFADRLKLSGAEFKRDFLRMWHGTAMDEENPAVFAAAGPEYG
ncbi:MAG: GNAT family N-acetyltransferase [Lentisphaeria bacterium]|nr:GNAT family N-acetyltransferase [Lentisphaeria bacterium]